MKPVLLIDFGSTYTKLTAVDVDEEKIIGTSQSFTTVATDINEGLHNALALLEEKVGKLDFAETYACSSAAGGLRMVTSGLVPELTSEAARLASLGAGAKVIGLYSFELTEDDIKEIAEIKPDIFLLCGGTDGGNSECILHNAKALATISPDFPIVIAGNRAAARECERILDGFETHICENVMPKFGVLNIEPTQKMIREIFLKRIISAKGLTQASSLLSGIMMPTPSAVLQAMELLSKGCEGESGIGDLVAVDVGGATTDVYSMADGSPSHPNTVCKGLPEPFSKRTVEGDIGMRYSLQGIIDAVGMAKICQWSGLSEERIGELTHELKSHKDRVPGKDDDYKLLDYALASGAIETAVTRHAGTLEETFTMMGRAYVQTGKDLTSVKKLIVTGGSLIHTEKTGDIASHAFYDMQTPMSLRPIKADILVDRKYILASMGLLSNYYPKTALKIMKKELELNGTSK